MILKAAVNIRVGCKTFTFETLRPICFLKDDFVQERKSTEGMLAKVSLNDSMNSTYDSGKQVGGKDRDNDMDTIHEDEKGKNTAYL